jgi:hypothetical protein
LGGQYVPALKVGALLAVAREGGCARIPFNSPARSPFVPHSASSTQPKVPPPDAEEAIANGEVLVLDGIAFQGGISWAEFYNPSTGTWTTDGSGNGEGGNTGQTVTLLRTGIVLTAGGTFGDYPREHVIPYADLFDPSTGNDVSTGSMSVPRHLHTATRLPNGQVLAAGGQSQKKDGSFFITNSSELCTP